MKAVFLSFLFGIVFTSVKGQAPDSTLQEYTGKYKFPDGSVVTEVTVVIENGVLIAQTAIGNSELKKTESKDVFDIVAYAGVATYKRNTEGKISAVRVQVQDVDLEGTKVETSGKLVGR
jgi:hypothetical protein